VAACFAQETDGQVSPLDLVEKYMWDLAANWGEQYQYALDTQVEDPGSRGDVITDLDILSAVQAVLGTTAPPAE